MKTISSALRILRKAWKDMNEPSKYDIWKEAFKRLEEERNTHGHSAEYWRIWYDEVCPTYREMTEEHRKIGVGYGPLTCYILNNIDRRKDAKRVIKNRG